MIKIILDGFSGKAYTLFDWEYTATGLVVTLHNPLAEAIRDGLKHLDHQEKTDKKDDE